MWTVAHVGQDTTSDLIPATEFMRDVVCVSAAPIHAAAGGTLRKFGLGHVDIRRHSVEDAFLVDDMKLRVALNASGKDVKLTRAEALKDFVDLRRDVVVMNENQRTARKTRGEAVVSRQD